MAALVAVLVVAAVGGLGWWIVQAAGWRFAAKRLGQAIVILLIVTFGTTVMLSQFEGDPCLVQLGTGASEEAVAECREDRKLDKNIFVQYWDWLSSVLTGDLGVADFNTNLQLTTVLEQRLPRTFFLFLYSQVMALAIAVPAGIWSAYQAGRTPRRLPGWALPAAVVALVALGVVAGWSVVALVFGAGLVPLWIYHGIRGGPAADKLVTAEAFILLSIPVFVMGEALRYWFAVRWDWYSLAGYTPLTENASEHFRSLWLPALVLALALAPVYLRLLRADMIQNLQQDYVLVARAKGMTNRWVLLRHVLRPSTLTLLTVAGLNIAQLVNGGIVVEFIYDLDGMGSFLIERVAARAFFPVQTVVALVAVIFVLANTVVDLVYTSVDPRVQVEARA